MKKFDVVALGELLIDFIPLGLSENNMVIYEQNPGGAPANALAAVSKLGGYAAFIGKVGDDAFGNFLNTTLKNENIDTTGLIFDKKINTTLAFVTHDENNDRDFSFYRKPGADIMLAPDEIDDSIIKNSTIFHFGSLSLTDEPVKSATKHALDIARENNLYISFDPNLRPPLWDDLNIAREEITNHLQYADILKISEEELAFIVEKKLNNSDDYILEGKKLMEKYNITYIFITLGEKGSIYLHNGFSGSVESIKVNVVDTTGAGDAFTGTVLFYLSKFNKEDFLGLEKSKLQDIVKKANLMGALTTTKRGGIKAISSLENIDAYL